MTTLLLLAATHYFFKILEDEKVHPRSIALYGAFVAMALLSHYTTVYIVFAHILIFLVKRKHYPRFKFLVLSALIPIVVFSAWMVAYGFEGLELISERSARYKRLSAEDPMNVFYMALTPRSFGAVFSHNLMAFAGNTINNMHIHIRVATLTLLLPIVLLIPLKERFKDWSTAIWQMGILTISAFAYATLMAILAGHIIPFEMKYSIASIPYFSVLFAIAIYEGIKRPKLVRRPLFIGVMAMQLGIMLLSTCLIYVGITGQEKVDNKYEARAADLNSTITQENLATVQIVHRSIKSAREMNKYLDPAFLTIPQVIDTTAFQGSEILKVVKQD